MCRSNRSRRTETLQTAHCRIWLSETGEGVYSDFVSADLRLVASCHAAAKVVGRHACISPLPSVPVNGT